ncbi:hypothetical protein QTP86_004194 [Hemibagrus guttatus]|nr:hypothetical protein QTP86_004194 [Hemibagrus guttatus]
MSELCIILLILCIGQIHSICGQECSSTQELQNSLRQAQKLLASHEASYLQSLRSLKRKISQLQNSTARMPSRPGDASCPKLEAPVNGRKLGKVLLPGHEVHFLCDPGYELVGSETRQCRETLTWSGQQAVCIVFATTTNISASTSGAAAATSFPLTTLLPFVQPSKCSQVQGTTHCSCEAGYTISGRDTSICTDIDECEVFHNGPAGRLCVHACVNTPGGYRCSCPAGYQVSRDGRSCRDIDECATRQNNCTRDRLCVNTYGGFQCVKVECPRTRDVTYAKTSPTRCERNPCPVDNKACSRAPVSVSYHHMSVVSNLSAPRVLFRVSAVRMIGDALRFAVLESRGRRHFSIQRSDRQTGELLLLSPIQGPDSLEVEVEMSELEKRELIGRYITKITFFVSQYEF